MTARYRESENLISWTHHLLVSEGLEVLELPLGGVLALGVALVHDLGRADLAAVVDVARQRESGRKKKRLTSIQPLFHR